MREGIRESDNRVLCLEPGFSKLLWVLLHQFKINNIEKDDS